MTAPRRTRPGFEPGYGISQDERVVIHLESGDEVVILYGEIGRGDLPGPAIDAYESKYEFRPPRTERWFVLRPSRAVAWLESEYPTTATRFDFER